MLGCGEVNSTYNHSANREKSLDFAALWLRFPAAEVWLKFLLALLGLGVAFGAALLSTASGEAGNPWASVILASFSLLMAAVVGLVTVPYLARRVAVERLRQTLHYEVTKVGVVYVLVTLVIGIAALNTGNNLLYIVVAAMLAAILVSGVVSALILRGLELEVRLPEQVFAGQSVGAQIGLRNPRRLLPAFSISVIPARRQKRIKKQWRMEPTTFIFPLNRAPGNQWLKMRDWQVRRVTIAKPPAGIFEGVVYFPYLPPQGHLFADLELRFARRGRYRESTFGVATRFPFAFLAKTRDIALQREVLVYPPVQPQAESFEILSVIHGEWETFVRGRGSDLYRIRQYMPEDSARHVDWKATAKSGSLKVREFTREDEHRLRLIFDNPVAGMVSDQEYERAVNLAASLAWRFSLEDVELSFFVSGYGNIAGIYDFLAQLAVIEPQKNSPETRSPESEGRHIAGLENAGEYTVLLTARAKSDFSAALGNRSYFVFIGDS